MLRWWILNGSGERWASADDQTEAALRRCCYHRDMTTVEIVFRYATPPSERVSQALARVSDVYGIRRIAFDRPARTLRVEYDATRLNAAVVTKLVREAGLDVAEELPMMPAPKPEAPATPTV